MSSLFRTDTSISAWPMWGDLQPEIWSRYHHNNAICLSADKQTLYVDEAAWKQYTSNDYRVHAHERARGFGLPDADPRCTRGFNLPEEVAYADNVRLMIDFMTDRGTGGHIDPSLPSLQKRYLDAFALGKLVGCRKWLNALRADLKELMDDPQHLRLVFIVAAANNLYHLCQLAIGRMGDHMAGPGKTDDVTQLETIPGAMFDFRTFSFHETLVVPRKAMWALGRAWMMRRRGEAYTTTAGDWRALVDCKAPVVAPVREAANGNGEGEEDAADDAGA